MKEYCITGKTLPEAYHLALQYLHLRGDTVDCPDYNTHCKEIAMTIVVTEPTQEPRISKFGIYGPEELQQYCMEMLDGILDFEVARGKWAYTYHQRMTEYPLDNFDESGLSVNQVNFVIAELKSNPNSRRAVIDVRDNRKDLKSPDPACLQHIQFMLRHGKLDMQVLFRSNDAIKATFMNAFALTLLQERIAAALEVPVGTYTHRANSFHAYERDWRLLEAFYANCMFQEMAYVYAGNWKELMEEAIPNIQAKIAVLKERT